MIVFPAPGSPDFGTHHIGTLFANFGGSKIGNRLAALRGGRTETAKDILKTKHGHVILSDERHRPSMTFASLLTRSPNLDLFVNYSANKLLYSGNTAPFGGVILGSNPSGVAT
jgi:hypothetical protein